MSDVNQPLWSVLRHSTPASLFRGLTLKEAAKIKNHLQPPGRFESLAEVLGPDDWDGCLKAERHEWVDLSGRWKDDSGDVPPGYISCAHCRKIANQLEDSDPAKVALIVAGRIEPRKPWTP